MTDAAEEVRAAAMATRAAGTARYALTLRLEFAAMRASIDRPGATPSDGSLKRDLLRAARGVGKLALQGVGALASRPYTVEGEVDLGGRRWLVHRDSYHVLSTPDGMRGGGSGGEWSEPDENGFDSPEDKSPLWMCDALTGTVAATEAGAEEVRGVASRRLDVHVDLSIASRETPGGVAAPSVPRFEDLLSLPLTVWLGDGQIRRVVREQELGTHTVELWDHGTPIDPVLWLRPPSRDA